MTSLCNSIGDQKPKNVTDHSALCPYLDKMGPWIINVMQDVVPNKLNLSILGPKHCQVLQEEKINLPHNDDTFRVITDGKTLVHAMFTEDAIARYKKRCEEQDSDSQREWEQSVIMLEEFKVVHLPVSKKEYGEFILQVEKFLYLGEPSVRSEEYLDLPFPFTWPEDYPYLKQKCQEVWELHLLANGAQTGLEIINMDSTVVNSGYIETLCKEKTADQFLIISPSEEKILNDLPEWKENEESSKVHITENDYLIKESTEIEINESETSREVLQAYSPIDSEAICKNNYFQECSPIEKDKCRRKSSLDRTWLRILSMKSKNRQRKLSDWRSIFKRSLKSFARLKNFSSPGGKSEGINLQITPESPSDLFTSSAPPDISVDPHDHSYLQKNGDKNKEFCSKNDRFDIMETHECSLVKENDLAENQRLIALKDVNVRTLCNDQSEILQDKEMIDFQLSQITDCVEGANIEKKLLCTDSSALTIADEHDGNCSDRLNLGISASDDWINYLSDSMQVQCSGSLQSKASLNNDKSAKYSSPDICNNELKSNKDGSVPKQNVSETCIENISSKLPLSDYLHDNLEFETNLSTLPDQNSSRECILSSENNYQKGNNFLKNSSIRSLESNKSVLEENVILSNNSSTQNNKSPLSLDLAIEVCQTEEGALKMRNVQKRKKEGVDPYQAKVSKSVTSKYQLSPNHNFLELNLPSGIKARSVKHAYKANSSPTSDSDSEDGSNTSEAFTGNNIKCTDFYSRSSRTSKRINKKYFLKQQKKLNKGENNRNDHSDYSPILTSQNLPTCSSHLDLRHSYKSGVSSLSSLSRNDCLSSYKTHRKSVMNKQLSSVCSSSTLRKYPEAKTPSLLTDNSRQMFKKIPVTSRSSSTSGKKRSSDLSNFNIFEPVSGTGPEYLYFSFNPHMLKKMWEKIVHLSR